MKFFLVAAFLVAVFAAGLPSLTFTPALSSFTEYSPPWEPARPIATSLAAVTLLLVSRYYTPFGEAAKNVAVFTALVTTAAFLLFVYSFLLTQWTVRNPQKPEERWQVGLTTDRVSLTEHAWKWRSRQADAVTSFDLMLALGGFEYEGAQTKIWQPWSIFGAGLVLVGLYTTCICTWCFAWAGLSKSTASETPWLLYIGTGLLALLAVIGLIWWLR